MGHQEDCKVIAAAQEVLKAAGYFVENLWHVKNVHFMCEQFNLPELDDEEAMQVMQLANRRFDGEVGLSWPQLEAALRSYMLQKAIVNGLCNVDA